MDESQGSKGPVAWATVVGWGGYPGVGEQWGAMMLRGGGGGRTGSLHEATEATVLLDPQPSLGWKMWGGGSC